MVVWGGIELGREIGRNVLTTIERQRMRERQMDRMEEGEAG